MNDKLNLEKINQMARDLGFERFGCMEKWQYELCDKLIRAGWRRL